MALVEADVTVNSGKAGSKLTDYLWYSRCLWPRYMSFLCPPLLSGEERGNKKIFRDPRMMSRRKKCGRFEYTINQKLVSKYLNLRSMYIFSRSAHILLRNAWHRYNKQNIQLPDARVLKQRLFLGQHILILNESKSKSLRDYQRKDIIFSVTQSQL